MLLKRLALHVTLFISEIEVIEDERVWKLLIKGSRTGNGGHIHGGVRSNDIVAGADKGAVSIHLQS
ncbi:hypothetical protein [Rhodopseudomonas sp. BR0M22]|uniref:hypothetical protein n=1 Tax=Rhodopseudomonas sp. BR0M22 TaxID=2269369 RepID=UPI001FED6637|nr:hypothetical protein [Rhodopseudomonas sp. BR0M22]